MHFFEQERDFLERDYWGYLPARQQPTHLRSLWWHNVLGQLCNIVSGQVSTFNLTDLTGLGDCIVDPSKLVWNWFWRLYFERPMCYTDVHCHLSDCNHR